MKIRDAQIRKTAVSPRTQAGLRAVFLFVLGVLMFSPMPSKAQGGLGIAAVVNDEAISVLDLNARIAMVLEASQIPDTPQARNRIAGQVLRGLIDERLKLQAAKQSGVVVPDKGLDQAISDLAKRNKINAEQLAQHLASIGSHISSLRTQLEAQIAWNQYAIRKLAPAITISDDEIDAEINRIQSNAGKPEYLLAEIFLPVDASNSETDVRDFAQRLLMQIQQGAKFSELARNFSQSPSAALSGDMGWVQYANLDPDLQKAVPKIPAGNVSQPIRLPSGYNLIMVRKVRASPGLDAKADATVKLSQYHIPVAKGTPPEQVQQVKAQLIATTRSMTSCQQINDAGLKAGSLMSGSLGEMTISTLPDNFKSALANLGPGQKTLPIETGGGWAVMMVCERTNAGVDMEKIRKDIRLQLKANRTELSQQRSLRDLRREAFVDVRL